jgi:hypothetical protein
LCCDGIVKAIRFIATSYGSCIGSRSAFAFPFIKRRILVARKTIRVSDKSGAEIPEGKGATVRITFADARRGVRELDLTDAEAEALGGRAVARRGRKPKSMS